MGVACEFLVFVQGSRVQVMGNVCVVTEGRTLLVITQVSSGLKNPIFSALANLNTFMR